MNLRKTGFVRRNVTIGTHIPVARSARKHHFKCVAHDLPNVTGRRKHEEPQNPTPSYIAASYVGFELFD